jgi:Ca2+-binding RTX toxin-like protein
MRPGARRAVKGVVASTMLLAVMALSPHSAAAATGDAPTVAISNSTLEYHAGAGQANAVTILLRSETYTVVDTGVTALADGDGPGGCTVSGNSAICPDTQHALFVKVDLGDMNDSVRLETDVHDQEWAPDSLLIGGPGNDTLVGTIRDDTFRGGPGNDSFYGNVGTDTADYSDTTANLTIDLSLPGAQDTGAAGNDLLYDVENVIGGEGNDVLTGDLSKNTLMGNGGDDRITSRDLACCLTADTVNCGPGHDVVVSDYLDSVDSSCESNDNGVPPQTHISIRPQPVTSNTMPTFEWTTNEPNVTFTCRLDDVGSFGQPFPCASPFTVGKNGGLPDGSYVLSVSGKDEFGYVESPGQLVQFRVDTVAPVVTISGPSGANPHAPSFSITASETDVALSCALDTGVPRQCHSPFQAPPLSDGTHVLRVSATDAAGNRSVAELPFTVATVATPPPARGAQVQGATIRISGKSLRLSGRRTIAVSLTCAGSGACEGRLAVTTYRPIKTGRGKRRQVTLGSTAFTVAANSTHAVEVHLSKTVASNLRRTRRVEVKAVATLTGQPRAVEQVFVVGIRR